MTGTTIIADAYEMGKRHTNYYSGWYAERFKDKIRSHIRHNDPMEPVPAMWYSILKEAMDKHYDFLKEQDLLNFYDECAKYVRRDPNLTSDVKTCPCPECRTYRQKNKISNNDKDGKESKKK